MGGAIQAIYDNERRFSPNSQENMSYYESINHWQVSYAGIIIELIRGDIFSDQDPQMIFALVNPANSRLVHGGGLAE